MADASADSSQEQKDDADKKKKNILEEKSKEDLIRLVRKYLNLLQKSKNKTDELTEKCLTLEKEKNEAVQARQSTEKELQCKIEALEHNISELKTEKSSFDSKDQEIEELKQKLKETNPLLRENEEQIQCLKLQLQTLKASCQCIQDENKRLQDENTRLDKLNKERLEELNSLADIHKSLSLDFSNKVQEYELLLNVKNDFEMKYETGVEKLHSLQTKTDKLISENESLQKDKIQMKCEICELKEYKEQTENKDNSVLLQDMLRYKSESKKYKEQVENLSKNNKQSSQSLTENETDNLNLDEHASKMESENLKLKITIASLEQEKLSLQSKLDVRDTQIQKLEKEIKNLATSSHLNDCKMGIELALLHGATTEGLIFPNEQINSKPEIPQTEESRVCKERNETYKNEILYPIVEASGLEYALLQGGDASVFGISNSESASISSMHIPSEEFVNAESNNSEPILKYKRALSEKEDEIEALRKNLREYSSLCDDTIEENNRLKEELETLRKKNVIHQETNTDFDSTFTDSPKELEQVRIEKADAESVNLLDRDKIKLCGNDQIIYNEIINIYKRIQTEGNFDSGEDISNYDTLDLLRTIENMYIKSMSDLEMIKQELNKFNLQLELLVIGVKQGVRQKTSNTSYQVENNIEENMNMLKLLLDELSTRANCFESKKMVQSHATDEICAIEDELLQMKELNQFLNDENRELNNELQKLKCNLNDINRQCETEYFGEVHQQSTELYSIDERNEFDDRIESNLSSNLDKETLDTSDVFVQTISSVKNLASQTESNVSTEKKEMTENTYSQTDSVDNNQQIIKQLTAENESLKNIVSEKSKLVENIHCEMDNLLTKVEELTVELKNKEDDLNHFQCLNSDLKRILAEAQNIKNQQSNALKTAHNISQDFKKKNIDLSSEVKLLSLTYKELMSNVNTDILKNIEQNYKHFSQFKETCIHKENSFVIVKEWINEFIKELENWYSFMEQLTAEALLSDISELENTFKESSETFFLLKDPCNKETCCSISESINDLILYKAKLFSAFYNHLTNYYGPLVNDLQNYKVNIIPNLENNIVELEKKIAENKSLDTSKDVKVVTDDVQKNSAEESLKNSLEDAEIKMNKFKQLAIKMKKELALTKEQYNGVILEKEILQKQNVKLTDELNKITEDQCKYVQNYQSLQNEFDKLQDESEVYKLNMKKLEEDLTAKLGELTSSKEQVLELENQLKSSKHLLDSNLSIKKELDHKCADLESKIIILESKITEKEQKIHSMENDVTKHLKDLNSAQEDIKSLKYQLELAQKEGNKKSLLDLEMADYERSITELNNKIKKKEDEIEELQNEIQSFRERNNCLQDELKSTETLKETEAKRAESLKGILEKTKSELNTVKEHEAELLSKSASFEVQIETMTQQEENFKLRLSETSVQIQHLQDVIKTSSENHQRMIRSYEQKVSNQKQEIHLAHKEVESVKQEFENYKIRVHSVLKQQKSVTPAITTIDGDLKEKLETMNEKLKLQVKDLSEKITAMSLEYETLQEEHDGLLQRYNKVIDDREQKDKEWHQRLELMNAEKNRLRATQEELSSQHLLQNEMLVATYKKQIKIMSEEHKRIVSDLQKQLDAADVEITRLQRDQQKLQGLPVTPSPQDSTTSFDLLSQERQEGEGSENTDEANTPIRHLSLATIPTSGFLPFEKLLQTPIEPGTPASYISNYDSEKLAAELNTSNKKIDHLNELLNDSESTNLRLSEQVRVLKDEVRRLENNKERQQHAENLEYLKNVFIKFATLQPGSEKAMLIPVLTTMLKLNSTEQQQLKSIAGDMQSADNINASWGGYLHRWSGLS